MAVARSPLTPRRARRPLLTASLSDPQPPPAPAAAAAGGERAGKWLHQQSSVRPGYIRGYISPGGGGGGNTSGNCGEKSEREENAEKGTYCQRLLWLRRRNKVVVVLLELHQEVHLAAGRCQKGKFGSDRCTQGGGGGGGWTHLLPAKKWGQRIQFWGSAVHNKERCQPSDFSPPPALEFWRRRGKRIYQRSRFIQSGLVSCPAESNEPRLAADLSEAPNIPPVVAKAPSQCGQSFKSGNPPTFQRKIL